LSAGQRVTLVMVVVVIVELVGIKILRIFLIDYTNNR
jgi:hypothetical protein